MEKIKLKQIIKEEVRKVLNEIKINNPSNLLGKIAAEYRDTTFSDKGESFWKRNKRTKKVYFYIGVGMLKTFQRYLESKKIPFPYEDGIKARGIDQGAVEDAAKKYIIDNNLYREDYFEDNEED